MAEILQNGHLHMESYMQPMVANIIYLLPEQIPDKLYKLSALNTSTYKQHFHYLFICWRAFKLFQFPSYCE